jgi:hypothetical protein
MNKKKAELLQPIFTHLQQSFTPLLYVEETFLNFARLIRSCNKRRYIIFSQMLQGFFEERKTDVKK